MALASEQVRQVPRLGTKSSAFRAPRCQPKPADGGRPSVRKSIASSS
jgi:hypothetical protein